jgi:hypothetical protein
MVFSFSVCRFSTTDQADSCLPFRVYDNQQASLRRKSDGNMPFFAFRMVRVENRSNHRVVEDGRPFFKGDAMFF